VTGADDHRAPRRGESRRADRAISCADLEAAARVGGTLREARQAAGLSQSELAGRMGVVQSEVSRLEAGRKNFTLGTLLRAAGALDVDLDVVIGRTVAHLC
jgi:ribosome-binding protein aMBF1 (putative translation factor)